MKFNNIFQEASVHLTLVLAQELYLQEQEGKKPCLAQQLILGAS